jgi:hypothetical protein
MNFSIKVDLTSLVGAQVQTAQDGTQALIIPIKANDLFYSQKGRVYLDLLAWENKNGADQYGYTHRIQQSLSKERRAMLPAGTYPPTLGSAKVLVQTNQTQQVYSQPNYSQTPYAQAPYTQPTPQQPQPAPMPPAEQQGTGLPF